MAGVTDLPFRQLCRRLGVGMVVGEMTASAKNLRATLKSRLRGIHLDEPEPRSIQIVGWDPASMAEAARYNVDQGASVIDINMGCPAKKVCKKLAGSALLGDEKRVIEILKAVVSAVEVPVTLKIRTGIDLNHINGVRIAKIAQSEGIQCLAVHGRTRACMYRGEAEYRTIKKIKQSVSIPVIANGDLDGLYKIKRVMKETAVDGIMIGRAAQGAPWFPGQVADYLSTGKLRPSPTLSEQKRIVLAHLQAIYSFYGGYQGVRVARKHIKWYTEKFVGSGTFRRNVNQLESPDAQQRAVSEFYLSLEEKSHLNKNHGQHDINQWSTIWEAEPI